jgi:peroxiredoxin Q/BCP
MNFFKGLVLMSLVHFQAYAQDITVGSAAPVAVSVDQDGKSVDLSQVYKANKYVLVYFYPKADTPGCTAQACSLRDAYQILQKNGVAIYGVSLDSVKSQKDFQKKYKLPFTLLADENKNVIKAFGVPTTMGFAKRQAYLIEEGKVAWLDRAASTKEQAADILKFLAKDVTSTDVTKGEK